MAESAQPTLALWVRVMYRTPSAYSMRSTPSDPAMAWPPSAPSSDATRPEAKTRSTSVAVSASSRAGVRRDYPAGQVDLLEHRGDGCVAGQRGRDVDRPELRADAAGLQPRQVGVGTRHRLGQVHRGTPPAQRPGQVVVPVDQREAAQQVPRRNRWLTHPASLGGHERGPEATRHVPFRRINDFSLFLLVNGLP